MWSQWRQRLTRLPWWHLAPLFIGIITAWTWAWLYGSSMVFEQRMWGYGWPGYVLDSWLVAHGLPQRTDDLRTLVYPGLLGGLGEFLGSYADAGVLLASMSVLVCIAACGVGATALAGGWAGGLAAICAGIALTHQEAPTTINQYPLLAACTATAMAMAMICVRWPRPVWAACAGLAAGLAWMVESRGLLVMPLVFAAVALGAWDQRKNEPWKLGLALGIALLMCGLCRNQMTQLQRHESEQSASYEAQLVDRQRDVVLRWIRSEEHYLESECGTVTRDELLQSSFVGTPCSKSILKRNLHHRLPRHLPLGVGLSLLTGLCALLPGVRGRRDSLESGSFLILVGGGLLFLASLTLMPRRYLLQVTPLLAILCATGPARLGAVMARWMQSWSPHIKWLGPSLCTGIAIWTMSAGAGGYALVESARLGTHYERYALLSQRMESELQTGDGLLDCGEHHVELSLLPLRTHAESPSKQADAAACTAWIEAPWSETGRAWILLSDDPKLHWRRDIQPETPLTDQIQENEAWEKFDSGETWEIWRWES
jgi:hypothetical protein